MYSEQAKQSPIAADAKKLLAFASAMTGGTAGLQDPDNPLPHGPWDPVIRLALERISVHAPGPQPWKFNGPSPLPWRTLGPVTGPFPDPWQAPWAIATARHPAIWDLIGGGPDFGSAVALNPQPLPPRFAFLTSVARTVIERAELMQELADAMKRAGEGQGIIIVGGYVGQFVDDYCGNDFRLRWPFPWPPPPWFTAELSGIDLVVTATQFDRAAGEAYSPDLRQALANAGAKLADVGGSRM